MNKHFEVTWKMYGTARVEAASMDDAIRRVEDELIGWQGMGLDVDTLDVDGVDVDS